MAVNQIDELARENCCIREKVGIGSFYWAVWMMKRGKMVFRDNGTHDPFIFKAMAGNDGLILHTPRQRVNTDCWSDPLFTIEDIEATDWRVFEE